MIDCHKTTYIITYIYLLINDEDLGINITIYIIIHRSETLHHIPTVRGSTQLLADVQWLLYGMSYEIRVIHNDIVLEFGNVWQRQVGVSAKRYLFLFPK